MAVLPPPTYVFLAAASFIAGAMNSVAGGGTLLTFPSLLGAGITPVMANATSTLSLVPGSLAGAYGFRSELPELRRTVKLFALPAIFGGFIGAKLLLWGGDSLLSRLVPWLILGASSLFLLQEPISRRLARRAAQVPDNARNALDELPVKHVPAVMFFVFLVAIYGGYFGAGIGILTLAALGFLGLTNIHQMNGLKNILAASINLVATITFIMAGKIDWLIAALMGTAAVLGGLAGAGLALKLGQKRVRQFVILIGFSIAALMFWRQAHP
jgi:uncharacterized protein